jgi:hypothetical protein
MKLHFFETPHGSIRCNVKYSGDEEQIYDSIFKLFKYSCIWNDTDNYDYNKETKEEFKSFEFDESIIPYFKRRFSYSPSIKIKWEGDLNDN